MSVLSLWFPKQLYIFKSDTTTLRVKLEIFIHQLSICLLKKQKNTTNQKHGNRVLLEASRGHQSHRWGDQRVGEAIGQEGVPTEGGFGLRSCERCRESLLVSVDFFPVCLKKAFENGKRLGVVTWFWDGLVGVVHAFFMFSDHEIRISEIYGSFCLKLRKTSHRAVFFLKPSQKALRKNISFKSLPTPSARWPALSRKAWAPRIAPRHWPRSPGGSVEPHGVFFGRVFLGGSRFGLFLGNCCTK